MVSRTASRIGAGSSSRSRFARLVSRSSGKPELALHLIEREEVPSPDVLIALAQCGERLIVLEDLERLLDDLVLLRRQHNCSGTPVTRNHHMLVALSDFI